MAARLLLRALLGAALAVISGGVQNCPACQGAPKASSRRLLRALDDAALNARKAEVGKKADEAEAELAADNAEHETLLADLRGRLDKAVAAETARRDGAASKREALAGEHATSQAGVDAREADAWKLAGDTAEDRERLRELRAHFQDLVDFASSKCQSCPLGGLVQLSQAMRAKTEPDPGVRHELLVREVEAAEERYADAQKAITTGALNFGAAQRRLLEKLDAAGVASRKQQAADDQAAHALESRSKSLEHQLRAAGTVKDLHAAEADQVGKDIAAVEGKLAELEDAMRHCDCHPERA